MKNEEFNNTLLRERLKALKSLRNQHKHSKKLENEIRYLENIIISKVYNED